MSRIYRVLNVTTGDDYLVRAHSQAQAIRHVVADQYRAQVAGQETIVEHLMAGGAVMDATREPEPVAADQPDQQQDDEALVLTERQRMVVGVALYLFINNAYAQADHCAQQGPVEHVAKFLDDAKDAEELRANLTKRGAA